MLRLIGIGLRYFKAPLLQHLLSFERGRLPIMNSSFNRLYKTVVLNEDDIEEKFVKGWGKGGQKVNKTSNCVELKHKPSGIIVKCHQDRSLTRNRALARKLLEQKLDFLHNGKDSALGREIEEKKKRKSDRLRKRKAKQVAKNMPEINPDKKDEFN